MFSNLNIFIFTLPFYCLRLPSTMVEYVDGDNNSNRHDGDSDGDEGNKRDCDARQMQIMTAL